MTKELAKPDTTGALSDTDIADILLRWQSGEPLTKIAKSYPVSYRELWQRTYLQRKSLRKLTREQLTQALERWQAGETWTEIAADKHVSRLTLRRKITPLKKAKRKLLTYDGIRKALNRYQAGEALPKIAREYEVHTEKLRELLMHACWSKGEPIEAIAALFGTSRIVARKSIAKCVKLGL